MTSIAAPAPDPDDARRAWLPAAPARDAFFLLHGSESHAGWFEELGGLLAERGFAAYAADRPGWGRSATAPRGHLASYADALRFVERHVNALRERHERVHLAGLSWGGVLALYAAFRRGPLFDSVVLIAPGLVTRKDLAPVGKIKTLLALGRGDRQRTTPLSFTPDDFTYRAEKAAFIRDDPLAVRAVSAGFAIETFKMRRFLHENVGKRMLPPTLALLASDDAIVDTPATTELMLHAGATVRQYGGARHSLIFEAPLRVADDLASWSRYATDRAAGRVEDAGHAWVMGAGAVGQTLGALLALAGRPTVLIARPAQATAIRERGVELRLGDGVRRVGKAAGLEVAETPAEAAALHPTPPDLVLLTVKNYDTAAALDALAPALGPGTVLASFQNGVDNEPEIRRRHPDRPLIAGAVCAYLELVGPGRVHWVHDLGGLAAAAVYDPEGRASICWRRFFGRVLTETRWVEPDAAERVKWSKLILNVAFNAINAETGLSTPEILAHPEYGSLATEALRETFRVMRRRGIAPVDLPGYPVTRLARLARILPSGVLRRLLSWHLGRQAAGVSSTRQDRLRGRARTEIGDLNAAVVRAGAEAGVATSANAEIVRRFP